MARRIGNWHTSLAELLLHIIKYSTQQQHIKHFPGIILTAICPTL